jgi:hypothetical protein
MNHNAIFIYITYPNISKDLPVVAVIIPVVAGLFSLPTQRASALRIAEPPTGSGQRSGWQWKSQNNGGFNMCEMGLNGIKLGKPSYRSY